MPVLSPKPRPPEDGWRTLVFDVDLVNCVCSLKQMGNREIDLCRVPTSSAPIVGVWLMACANCSRHSAISFSRYLVDRFHKALHRVSMQAPYTVLNFNLRISWAWFRALRKKSQMLTCRSWMCRFQYMMVLSLHCNSAERTVAPMATVSFELTLMLEFLFVETSLCHLTRAKDNPGSVKEDGFVHVFCWSVHQSCKHLPTYSINLPTQKKKCSFHQKFSRSTAEKSVVHCRSESCLGSSSRTPACRNPFVRVVASLGVVSCCRLDLDRVLVGSQDCDVQTVVHQIVDHNVSLAVVSLIPAVCVRDGIVEDVQHIYPCCLRRCFDCLPLSLFGVVRHSDHSVLDLVSIVLLRFPHLCQLWISTVL